MQKEMESAAQTAADILELDGLLEKIRVGRTGVFKSGQVVLKVCPESWRTRESINREISLINWIIEQGIRVPEIKSEIIEIGNCFVFASEFIANEENFLNWKEVGNSVRALHQLSPVNLDLPDCHSLIVEPLSGRISYLLQGERINKSEAEFLVERFTSGLEAYEKDDEKNVLCHGDLHSANIVFTSSGPYFLDWEKAGLGLPDIDLSKLVGQQERGRMPQRELDDFLFGYGSKRALDNPNIKSMRLISEVSGITYLLGSSSFEQSHEGRRRLEGLMSGKEIHWRNC